MARQILTIAVALYIGCLLLLVAQPANASCTKLLDAMVNITEVAPAPTADSKQSKEEEEDHESVSRRLLQVLHPSVNIVSYYPFYISFPPVSQFPYVSTAPAAMVSLLRGFGEEYTRPQMANLCGSGIDQETGLTSISAAFNSLTSTNGALASPFKANVLQRQTITSLRNLLAKGSTAILVAYQHELAAVPAGRGANVTQSFWATTWDSTHYAVLAGMDAHRVYLMDPHANAVGYINIEEFIQRWHTFDTVFSGEDGNSGDYQFCHQCVVVVEWVANAGTGVGSALRLSSRPVHLPAL